jgi:hypothetical protein
MNSAETATQKLLEQIDLTAQGLFANSSSRTDQATFSEKLDHEVTTALSIPSLELARKILDLVKTKRYLAALDQTLPRDENYDYQANPENLAGQVLFLAVLAQVAHAQADTEISAKIDQLIQRVKQIPENPQLQIIRLMMSHQSLQVVLAWFSSATL